MRWFDRWFQKQAKRAWEAEQDSNVLTVVSGNKTRSPDRIDANGINMKLHIANGGYIIEFHRYDDHKDRAFNELHVINDGEDLGQRLSEIIVQYIISNYR
jgi:hypothetical protein